VYSLGASSLGFERIFRRFSVEAGGDIQEGLVLQLGSLEETINVAYTAEPAPAVTTITPAARERYRQNRARGGTIAPPVKIRDQQPQFPESIRNDDFDGGKVVLEALIAVDGTVGVLQILAGVDPATMTTTHPELARSAVEAVDGWRYEPTLLHGVPVETRMTINVTFLP